MRRRTAVPFVMLAMMASVCVAVTEAPAAVGTTNHEPARSGRFVPGPERLRPLLPPVGRLAKMVARAAPGGAVLSGGGGTPPSPLVGASWRGADDPTVAPPDTYGAIGPRSYVEIINRKIAVFDRSGRTIAAAGLGAVMPAPPSAIADPQILWDPLTRRFYFSALDTERGTILWGFTKGPAPRALPGDVCAYEADFGYDSAGPDFPRLGQTADFLLVGVNVFDTVGYFVGSDIDWIAKPQGSGILTTCPSGDGFAHGRQSSVRNADGSLASTPVPAIQTDPSHTGWVVAAEGAWYGHPARSLTLFAVTKDPDGTANIPATGTGIPVAPYSPPSNAPQLGSTFKLDAGDGRLRHAVSGIDPERGGAVAVWTSHTVAGGSGAEERWYEIDPVRASILQTGTVSSASLYVFNGAVSPDRQVNGKSQAFGSSMVLGFTTSSRMTDPAAQMVVKLGSNPQSGFVMVKPSPGPDQGYECFQVLAEPNLCRWGDYSGASPDPMPRQGARRGWVWLTNEWVTGETRPTSATWGTWNWAGTP